MSVQLPEAAPQVFPETHINADHRSVNAHHGVPAAEQPRPRPRPLPYPRQEPPAELPSGTPIDALDAALHGARRAGRLPLPRWIGPLAVCSIIGFLPWIVYLGFTLPEKVRAVHYDIAWLGFDSAMWAILAALAFCALRRLAATGPIAAVASMMLLVDAWFDVFTGSGGRGETALALLLALCGEVPLAILCGWAAVHAERIRARAYRSLHLRWERAVRTADKAVTVGSAITAGSAVAVGGAVSRLPVHARPAAARR